MNSGFYDKHVLTYGPMIVGLQPDGGYVSRWQVMHPSLEKPVDVLYRGKTLKRTGIPILFPQFSAAPNLPKHGFGRESVWELDVHSEQSASMSLSSTHIKPEYREVFPYLFHTTITIAIRNEFSFSYTLKVLNLGRIPMPISPGLHPYWSVPHESKKDLRIEGITGFDAAGIDWSERPPDTAFAYAGKTEVISPDRRISIQDITPGKEQVRHIVVWSQKTDQDDFDFVCVEPICGYNNAFVESPISVPAGADWQMELEFAVKFT